jgi:beta-glucosidase
MSNLLHFPLNFIWGTAMSAHQTEGNNTNSDWWLWENRKKSKGEWPLEPSLEACDSYSRFAEDFDLCKGLNNNAVRISIEWARLEPEEGIFDEKEFAHYKTVLADAKSKGLQTFVTLHHFTNPLWFFKKGGWLNLKAPVYFSRYAQKVAQELDAVVDYYLTINEPQVYAMQAYLKAEWPPAKMNPILFMFVQFNFIRAHNKAYETVKRLSKKPVGIVKHIQWFKPATPNFWDVLSAKIIYYFNSYFFLNHVQKRLDFIGVNYYFTNVIRNFWIHNPKKPATDMAWYIDYSGLEKILLSLNSYKLPIYITENGLADADDAQRKEFIIGMLTAVYKAMLKGTDVRGYFHWSLIDNYEWHHGFWPRFGLVEIDRKNMLKRIPRNSYTYYAQICKTGVVESE